MEVTNMELSVDTFVQNLKSLIRSSGKSRRQIAAALDIDDSTMTKWLLGRIPDPKFLVILSEYFNVPMEELLGVNYDRVQITVTPEAREFISLYSHASKDDKLVIRTILQKYEDQ